ncbi:hypothetical protein [Paraclostridium tenue]|uniref:Phage protein n=1 Tax=Paraclostridium tenue TaxID=1737 RepID=A0ABN1M2Y3_9FIRM|nr:hypothetical protein [[Eubacterium] tenue]MBC8630760.1 hypothetical protein [[Eubacterium] tenue]
MKIILNQPVIGNKKGEWLLLQKEFNSDLIPMEGYLVEDALWDKEKKIEEVLLSFNDNCYYVTMEAIKFTDSATMTIAEYKDMAKLHGWK